MPTKKEPKHFATDLDSGSERDGEVFVRDRAEYLQLFADSGNASAVGEATALYLFSRDAARNIRQFNPQAKIIVMLRNPVEVMHAFHGERFYNGNEDIEDFAEALAAEPDRLAGRRLPLHGAISAALQYKKIAHFHEQLLRYFSIFASQQIHIILFEELKRDVESVYRSVLGFLGVRPDFLPKFPVVNQSKQSRNQSLGRLFRNPPMFARAAYRSLLPHTLRNVVSRQLITLNTKRGARQAMPTPLRMELENEFSQEVRLLGELIGRDLSDWNANNTPVASKSS